MPEQRRCQQPWSGGGGGSFRRWGEGGGRGRGASDRAARNLRVGFIRPSSDCKDQNGYYPEKSEISVFGILQIAELGFEREYLVAFES